MKRVVIDAELCSRLLGLNDVLELCDESGRMIGYFHPVARPAEVEGSRAYCPISDEELLRREQEPGGRPLAEILVDLHRL